MIMIFWFREVVLFLYARFLPFFLGFVSLARLFASAWAFAFDLFYRLSWFWVV